LYLQRNRRLASRASPRHNSEKDCQLMTETPQVPDFDLDGFTPYRLAVAAQKLSEQLAKQYRVKFGISIPEWRVLVHLSRASGNVAVSVRDIEARVAM
jgi:hypothetical protein